MSKQVQEAYIVAVTRTPVGKAPRGMFRYLQTVCLLCVEAGVVGGDAKGMVMDDLPNRIAYP
jgi:acetyl-CoA acyltransferase